MERRRSVFLGIVGGMLLFLIMGIYFSPSLMAGEEKLYLLTSNIGKKEALATGGSYKFSLKVTPPYGDSQFEANKWISFFQGALTDGKFWEDKSTTIWGTARLDKVVITFDLKNLYLIKEVKFYTYNGGRGGYYYNDFTLYLSDDGVKYREAGKIDGTTFEEDKNFWTSFDNIDTGARYAAIDINCGGHTRIYEVEIWGSKIQEIPQGAVSSRKGLMSIEGIEKGAPANPFKVLKKEPLFKELLSDSPGGYRTGLWSHWEVCQLKDTEKKFSKVEWEKEARKNLIEAAEAGLMGPGHPWVLSSDNVFWDRREFYQKYGQQLYHGWYEHFFDPNKFESLVDPAWVKACLQEVINYAVRYKDEDFMWGFIGKDEPTVATHQGKKSESGPFMQKADKEVLTEYGFNKYGMPAPNDPDFWEHPEDHPFQWIAFNRWAAEKYNQSKIEIYKTIKGINPRFKFVPCDYGFMGGVPAFDYSGIANYCDVVQCDAYASSAEYSPWPGRKGRGVYNHGFGTKLLSDLTGKPVWTIVQAFDYDYNPTPEDIREWASQALRNGATYITFFDGEGKGDQSSPYTRPDRYKMMLNIARQMKNMNKIKIPNDPDTAIFFSSDSHSSQGQNSTADEVYTAYALLGEKIGSWFDFISDRQIERGIKSLDKYKVLYIPYGEYQRSSIIDRIEEYVKKGGVVIAGDPLIFSRDINGEDISRYREQIFGVSLKEQSEEKEIKITDTSGYSGIKKDMVLPVFKRQIFEIKQEQLKLEKVDNAYNIIVTDKKARIMAAYPDGEPAIVERNYGKGRVIYFAANPFTPESILGKSAWSEFFSSIQKSVGAKINRDIWRFELPIENEFPLVTKEKKTIEIKKVVSPVLIDGRLDDPGWRDVGNPIRLVEYTALEEPLYATEVYLGWDPQYLYIAFRCLEPEIERMLNVATERDDPNIWQESSIEIFLDPQCNREDYYQFLISAKGVVADQFGLEGTKKWNSGIRAATSIGKDCWIAETAIPIKDVAQRIPIDGVVWTANLVRNRHLKEETAKDVELSTWTVRGAFHQPDQFGLLVFRE